MSATRPALPGPLVLARTLVFVSLSVGLAVSAHLAGHGQAPGAGDLALALLVSLVAVHPLARRERGLPGLSVGVALSQGGLHVLFLGAHEHAAGESLAPAPAMLWAHTGAAAALVLWLRWGERQAMLLARRLVAALVRLVAPPLAGRPRGLVTRSSDETRPRQLLLAPSRRRGPPRSTAAFST